MKYKILIILCALCILSGCRVELPPQSAVTPSSSSSQTASSQSDPGSAASGSAVSALVSTGSSAMPPASSASPEANASAPASSGPAAAKSSAPAAVKEQTCTLFISCGEILKNRDKFSADQLSIVPQDGVIYGEKAVVIQSGDTVFSVLLRETKANKIQMESATSPVYQTEYVKGIANIYEKDFGSASGWMYTVNGKQPPVAASGFKLKSGDKIQWLYVCGQ
ncbi:DUF4430 domain-containing protein [Caproiciproducens sp.]|uniref:DUF4430 domain-containing protein n=1 Tax=Caproiciproducens sp. TaxID=1954376 RepID=UPI00289650CD|nr:DUF4430 domain-containing protein [Caproiciproducens sp.]